MKLKPILSAALLAGSLSITHADVCISAPGSVTCGKGEVASLSGNGTVTLDGTTINGSAVINGM